MKQLGRALARHFPLITSLATTRLRRTLVIVASLWVAEAYGVYAQAVYSAKDLFTRQGTIVGNDFVVFRMAGRVAGTPEMTTIYKMENMAAKLRAAYPGHGSMLVGWQYPPTMFLLVKPLAFLPHVASFALWVALFGTVLFFMLRTVWPERTALFLAMASPAVFQSVITGQTGLLTGALLLSSAYFARTRPLQAGIAAGLLTLKPQLGLLIPLAFVAGRCWRAFVFAALTATSLAAVSVFAYGVAPWTAFAEALQAHGGRLGAATGFPFFKLVTPFGAVRMLGLPTGMAMPVQLSCTALLAVYVVLVWRRTRSAELRMAALGTASLLATPYGFYYELAFLVPPIFAIAKLGLHEGWLKGERLALIALWCASLLPPGGEKIPGFPISFAVTAAAFAVVFRRAWWARDAVEQSQADSVSMPAPERDAAMLLPGASLLGG